MAYAIVFTDCENVNFSHLVAHLPEKNQQLTLKRVSLSFPKCALNKAKAKQSKQSKSTAKAKEKQAKQKQSKSKSKATAK